MPRVLTQPLEYGTRTAGGRSRSLPRSWTRRGITDGAERERAAGAGEQQGGEGGEGGEGGGGGGRLRGLVARAGRTLDASLQMVADGKGWGAGGNHGCWPAQWGPRWPPLLLPI